MSYDYCHLSEQYVFLKSPSVIKLTNANVIIPFNQEVINNHKFDINCHLNGNISGNLNDNLNNNEQNILEQLLLNPRTTLDEDSILLNIPKRTISRYFKSLQEKGYIERIGSKKTGLWKIKK